MSRAQRGHYYGPRVHDFPYIPWTQCITCLDHCMFTKIKEFARVNSNGQKYTLQSQRNGLYRTLLRQCACLLSRYKLRKRTRHRRTILGSLSTAAGQTKPHPLHLWRRRCRPRNHRTRSDSAAPPFLYFFNFFYFFFGGGKNNKYVCIQMKEKSKAMGHWEK